MKIARIISRVLHNDMPEVLGAAQQHHTKRSAHLVKVPRNFIKLYTADA
jgi:hypothetical protein